VQYCKIPATRAKGMAASYKKMITGYKVAATIHKVAISNFSLLPN